MSTKMTRHHAFAHGRSRCYNEHAVGLLWGMYKQEQEWRRHHERLRYNATAVILTLSSAITTVILFDGSLNYYDIPLEFLVAVLGIVGVFLCDRHYERAGFHSARGNGTITKMFQKWPKEFHAKELNDLKDREHEKASQEDMLVWKMRRKLTWAIFKLWNLLCRSKLKKLISERWPGKTEGEREKTEKKMVDWRAGKISRWVRDRTEFLGSAGGLWKTIHYVVFVVGVGLIAFSLRAPLPVDMQFSF